MCPLSKTILRFSVFFILVVAIESCKEKSHTDTMVQISTEFGEIKIKLYDETPLHRDNFIQLVEDGFYTDLLFHRVIQGFMIQGGDPDSKNAAPGAQLGQGGPGYTIPAEIVYPKYYHKKGALAAARKPDQVNPTKASSGSQFYIVQGRPTSSLLLEKMVLDKNDAQRQEIFYKQVLPKYSDTLDRVQKTGDPIKIADIQQLIMLETDKLLLKQSIFNYTQEQVDIYNSLGGTPNLDGDYTVFGEVVEGLNILDSIATVATDGANRPLEDIKMNIKIIK